MSETKCMTMRLSLTCVTCVPDSENHVPRLLHPAKLRGVCQLSPERSWASGDAAHLSAKALLHWYRNQESRERDAEQLGGRTDATASQRHIDWCSGRNEFCPMLLQLIIPFDIFEEGALPPILECLLNPPAPSKS